MRKSIQLMARGGDALLAPRDTETAFWAGLAGGAAGLVLDLRLTSDDVPVCMGLDEIETKEGKVRLADLSWEELQKVDAGYDFRSTTLDRSNQPEGRGKDRPWEGNLPKKHAIHFMQLREVLQLLGRRTEITLVLPDSSAYANAFACAEAALQVVQSLGLEDRVSFAGLPGDIREIGLRVPQARLVAIVPEKMGIAAAARKAKEVGAEKLALPWERAILKDASDDGLHPDLEKSLATEDLELVLYSDEQFYAPSYEYIAVMKEAPPISELWVRGVLRCSEIFDQHALILEDDFSGDKIDRSKWSAGYSHTNDETTIGQKDGSFFIHIREGEVYSGGAAICLLPVHGRFDARTRFSVASPHQGTTFELAAITIDPGYFHIDNSDLNTRNVNLTFDVHGAPPYASSERDENDGFRCGWNNGFNLTRVDEDWQASSVNMYNKYGRDVGNGDADNPDGDLRLVRNGPVFATYYRDKYNNAWVCSGAMLVHNMSDTVFLRLAGKHWLKGQEVSPPNEIRFHSFHLYQF